jgi:putative transposase
VKRDYHRHLPHQIPEGSPIFVTWNLKGSMPTEVLNALRRERERLEREPTRPAESRSDRKIREGKQLFAMADKHLDSTVAGPMHLKDERAAKIVEDSLKFGVPERYELFAWCAMASHVHVLLKPIIELSKIMQGIKGFTARQINGIPSARGRNFWQDESYDHWPPLPLPELP